MKSAEPDVTIELHLGGETGREPYTFSKSDWETILQKVWTTTAKTYTSKNIDKLFTAAKEHLEKGLQENTDLQEYTDLAELIIKAVLAAKFSEKIVKEEDKIVQPLQTYNGLPEFQKKIEEHNKQIVTQYLVKNSNKVSEVQKALNDHSGSGKVVIPLGGQGGSAYELKKSVWTNILNDVIKALIEKWKEATDDVEKSNIALQITQAIDNMGEGKQEM